MKRPFYFLSTICMALILHSALCAQESAKRPFVPDDLSRFENVQSNLSPDGDLVLYSHWSSRDTNFQKDVWLLPTNGAPRKKFLSGAYTNFTWSPDSRRVAFVEHKGP